MKSNGLVAANPDGDAMTFQGDGPDRNFLDGLHDEEDIAAALRYKPRADICIVREIRDSVLRGLAMPDISHQSVKYRVIRVGPEVKDIKAGDYVHIMGDQNQTWAYIPRTPKDVGEKLFQVRAVAIPIVEVFSA